MYFTLDHALDFNLVLSYLRWLAFLGLVRAACIAITSSVALLIAIFQNAADFVANFKLKRAANEFVDAIDCL